MQPPNLTMISMLYPGFYQFIRSTAVSLALLLIVGGSSLLMSQELQWVRQIGGSGRSTANIAVDDQGNFCMIGSFQGEVDFDPSSATEALRSSADGDLYVAKYTAEGELLFVNRIGVNTADGNQSYPEDITVDTDGNIFVSASFRGDVSLGSTTLSSAPEEDGDDSRDILFARYDADGDLAFAYRLGSSGTEYGYALARTNDNKILLLGRFQGEVDFDPDEEEESVLDAGNNTDIFIARFDLDGSFDEAVSFGGDDYQSANYMEVDSEGNIIIAGEYRNRIALNPGSQNVSFSHPGTRNGFLAAYDDDFEPQFAVPFLLPQNRAEENIEIAMRIQLDQTDNILVTGSFVEQVNISGTVLNAAGDGTDIFLAKYRPGGDLIFARRYGSGGFEEARSVVADEVGNLYMAGNFRGTLDLDEDRQDDNLSSTGRGDGFLAQLDDQGAYNNVQHIRGGGEVFLGGLFLHTAQPQTMLMAGTFEENVVLSETVSLTSEGNTDLFFARYDISQPPPEDQLLLTSLSASEGRPGDQITLVGSGFTSEAIVNFGSEALTPNAVNSEGTSITVTVPELAPGSYQVSVTVGETTTEVLSFQINEPDVLNLQSLSIYVGQVGDEIVLRGENFGQAIGDNAVTFGETAAEVLNVNQARTELRVVVPSVAPAAYSVAVQVDGVSDTADRDFLVDVYCASSARDEQGIRIEQFRLEQIDNTTTGGCSAYANFTDQTAVLVRGTTYPLRISVGSCGADEPKALAVFIDWNGDQDFDDENEKVATSTRLSGTTTFDAEITVPTDIAVDRVTRLRVVLSSVSNVTPLADISPCGGYATGETQDYSVRLIDRPSPVITAVSPSMIEADVTSTLVISGQNFGNEADNITVSLGDGSMDATDLQVNEAGTQITVTLPPLRAGEYNVQVTLDGETVTSDEPITVTDEPVADQLPPAISVSVPPLLNGEADALVVNSEVTDASGVSAVTLEFLPIRQNPRRDNWQRISATREGTTDTYVAQLTNTDLDELGVQTRVIASDPLGNTDTSAIHYTFRNYTTTQPLGIDRLTEAREEPSANDYNLLAVPLQNQSVTQVLGTLGEYDTHRWRVWQLLDNGQGDAPYQEFGQGWAGDLRAGQGYMLIYTEEADFETTGQVVEATYDAPYTITLQPGCNLIGNPYTFALDWQAVLDFNNQDEELLTLKTFSSGFREASRLEAFQGGLVINPNEGQPITLALPVSTANPSGRLSSGTAERAFTASQWEVALTLSGGGLTTEGSIGMHPEAQPGFDRHDDFTPPRLADFLEFNSYHNDFFLPKFSQDVVPPAEQHRWQWEVVTHQPYQEVTLRWDQQAANRVPQTLTLLDEEQLRTIDMRQQDHYTFRVNAAGTRALQMVYGVLDDPALAATQVRVGEGYPNPATDQIHLPIGLPEDYRGGIALEVFDGTGRLVSQQSYEQLSPGYHTLTWQRGAAGERATPAGIYLFQLRFADRLFNQRFLLR